jgi:hypothetical protein
MVQRPIPAQEGSLPSHYLHREVSEDPIMAGEKGRLEELGGNSERKGRIVGRFIGILLLALISVLLVVVGFLLIARGRGRFPQRPVNQPHKESRIFSVPGPANGSDAGG